MSIAVAAPLDGRSNDLYPGSPLFAPTLGASSASCGHIWLRCARSFFLRSAKTSFLVGRTASDAGPPPTAGGEMRDSCDQPPLGPAENIVSLSGKTMYATASRSQESTRRV